MEELNKHWQIGLAAARAGMDRKTAWKYRDAAALPSKLKKPRTCRTGKTPLSRTGRSSSSGWPGRPSLRRRRSLRNCWPRSPASTSRAQPADLPRGRPASAWLASPVAPRRVAPSPLRAPRTPPEQHGRGAHEQGDLRGRGHRASHGTDLRSSRTITPEIDRLPPNEEQDLRHPSIWEVPHIERLLGPDVRESSDELVIPLHLGQGGPVLVVAHRRDGVRPHLALRK